MTGYAWEERESSLHELRAGARPAEQAFPSPSSSPPALKKKVRSTIKSAGDIGINPRTLTHGTI